MAFGDEGQAREEVGWAVLVRKAYSNGMAKGSVEISPPLRKVGGKAGVPGLWEKRSKQEVIRGGGLKTWRREHRGEGKTTGRRSSQGSGPKLAKRMEEESWRY
jgi:hypothetical protein